MDLWVSLFVNALQAHLVALICAIALKTRKELRNSFDNLRGTLMKS